jgi:hypothetical protein
MRVLDMTLISANSIGISEPCTKIQFQMISSSEEIKIIGAEGGVEPARPFGQRILSPVITVLPNLTKRYKPVFTRLAVVNVSLRLA